MVKPTKCWLVTGRCTELDDRQRELLGWDGVYDYITTVEEDHIHVGIRFETETPMNLLQAFFPCWNLQAVPEHRWDATVNYCRKSGYYNWKRERLPIQYSEPAPVWKEWQKRVIEFPADDRRIMVVIDNKGGSGKSFLANWHACRNQAVHVPIMATYKDLMRSIINRPSKWYIVDIPRAMAEKSAEQLYGAIETIKDGHAWDDRYKFEERWFDSPKITVFTNEEPPYPLLTPDRWVTEFV